MTSSSNHIIIYMSTLPLANARRHFTTFIWVMVAAKYPYQLSIVTVEVIVLTQVLKPLPMDFVMTCWRLLKSGRAGRYFQSKPGRTKHRNLSGHFLQKHYPSAHALCRIRLIFREERPSALLWPGFVKGLHLPASRWGTAYWHWGEVFPNGFSETLILK